MIGIELQVKKEVEALLPQLSQSEIEEFISNRLPITFEDYNLFNQLSQFLKSKADRYQELFAFLVQKQAPETPTHPVHITWIEDEGERRVLRTALEKLITSDTQQNRLVRGQFSEATKLTLHQLGFVPMNEFQWGYFSEVDLSQIVTFLEINAEQEPQKGQWVDVRVRAMFEAKERRQKCRFDELQNKDSFQQQMLNYRQQKRDNPSSNAVSMPHVAKREPKLITFQQIQEKRHKELQLSLSKKAWVLTNQFRKKNNLRETVWCDEIAKICRPHSQAMADRRVEFDHVGFNARINKIPYPNSHGCQNLAYNNFSEHDSAETTVDGWIKSPGHCRNLKSNTTHCGIAVARSRDGRWYYTQIFAFKN